MKANVEAALSNIDTTYAELIEIANDVFANTTAELDVILEQAYNDIETMTNDKLRDYMTRLSLKAYSFSEVKEKSAFKAALAETIRKQAYAIQFNEAAGTVGAKENAAILNTSAEILADEIHTLISNMLKTKLDEAHRVVNTLQTVLMTRMQEAKMVSEVIS